MSPIPAVRPPRIPIALIVAVVASGAAALGLQMSRMRLFSLGPGQELPSTMGVLTGYFGGLAAGSRWGGRWLERLPSPGSRCALMEVLTAVWALITRVLLPRVTGASRHRLGPAPGAGLHWAWFGSLAPLRAVSEGPFAPEPCRTRPGSSSWTCGRAPEWGLPRRTGMDRASVHRRPQSSRQHPAISEALVIVQARVFGIGPAACTAAAGAVFAAHEVAEHVAHVGFDLFGVFAGFEALQGHFEILGHRS